MSRNLASILATLVALAGGQGTPLWAREPISVTWKMDRLAVTAIDAPLVEVLAAVGRETGLRITGPVDTAARISVRFPILPPEKAFRRILGPSGFALKYDGPGGTISEVVLLAQGPGPSGGVAPPRTAAPGVPRAGLRPVTEVQDAEELSRRGASYEEELSRLMPTIEKLPANEQEERTSALRRRLLGL